MDEQSAEELRSLQKRAYGPNPDIHGDNAALARLRELEAEAQLVSAAHTASAARSTFADEARNETAFVSSPPAVLDTDPTDDPGVDEAPADPDAAASDPEAAPDSVDAATPAGRTRSRGRWAWIWAGALTLALVIGAVLAYVTMQTHPGNAGVLSADPDAPWPENLGNRGNGAQVFEEFHGLRVVLSPQDWAEGASTPCLFILPASNEVSIIGAGCGAGDFDPTAAIEVTASSPAALRDQFPVGSALQFVFHDDQVIVYSHGP